MNGDAVGVEGIAALPALALLVATIGGFAWAVTVVRRRLRHGGALVPWRDHDPVPWDGGDVLVVVALYLAAAMTAVAIVPESAPLVRRTAAITLATLAAAAAAAAWLAARGAGTRALGFVPGRWRDDLALAAGGLGLVLLPLLSLAALLNLLVPYEHDVVDLLGQGRDPGTLAIVLLSAVVVAPVAEEFFFRRVLQGWLERRAAGDAWGPVLLSSLAFAAAHPGQGLAFVPLFPLAIVLGVMARQTGSIVPCILMHALFNSVSIALLLAQGSPRPTSAG